MVVKFTLPFPPMSLPRHRHTRTGRTYELKSSKDHKVKIGVVAQQHIKKPMEGPLQMNCLFCVERPKSKQIKNMDKATDERKLKYTYPFVKPDLDNFAKMILDALEKAGTFHNDSQIVKMELEKTYVDKDGHTEIEIMSIG